MEIADPLRATDCVEPAVPPELSVMTSVAVRVPAALGENVNVMLHVPFGARERAAVQVVPEPTAKSPGFAPPSDNGTDARTRFACPVLVRVIGGDEGPLVVPTLCTVANVKDAVLKVAVGVAVEATTTLNALFAVSEFASVTVTVKLEVPAVVGVPEITPAALRLNPAGKVPDVTDHVYGAVPPAACSV